MPRTGVSIMQMDPGLDTGPVYCRRSLAIGPEENAGRLHDRLAQLGGESLRDSLPEILTSAMSPVPQDDAGVTYAPKLKKADALLDWTQSARELGRRVRAFNPWPVSETVSADGRRIRIWEAVALEEACARPVGSVVAANKQGIDVATGEGVLRILSLQPPGGKRDGRTGLPERTPAGRYGVCLLSLGPARLHKGRACVHSPLASTQAWYETAGPWRPCCRNPPDRHRGMHHWFVRCATGPFAGITVCNGRRTSC